MSVTQIKSYILIIAVLFICFAIFITFYPAESKATDFEILFDKVQNNIEPSDIDKLNEYRGKCVVYKGDKYIFIGAKIKFNPELVCDLRMVK